MTVSYTHLDSLRLDMIDVDSFHLALSEMNIEPVQPVMPRIARVQTLSLIHISSGLPLLTVLMVQVIGYATPLLPYQASPIVVAMGMAQVPARDGIRLCLALAAITFLMLVPLDYVWFKLLGQITH